MKKFLTLRNILACCAAVLGLVAVLLMFAPAISLKSDFKSAYSTFTGAQVAFGYTEHGKLVDVEILKFSFGYFLPFLLALAGIIFAVLALFGKLGKISGIVATACFLIAGIFFFCAVPFAAFGEGAMNLYATVVGMFGSVSKMNSLFTLGGGAIVAGIFSIISAALCAISTFVIKK